MKHIGQIAKMLGVGLNERFKLTDGEETIVVFFDIDGLHHSDTLVRDNSLLLELLEDMWEIQEMEWEPVENELFYYVTVTGDIDSINLSKTNTFSQMLVAAGNVFQTLEQAEINKEKILATFKIST